VIANPLLGIVPGLVAAPAALQFAVIDGGVRLPAFEAAQAEVIEKRPAPIIERPEPTAPAPVVPVYPRKQARH